MNRSSSASDRINLRLTPTDRLTISRIIDLMPSTVSDAIRYCIHTAFLLLQLTSDRDTRLVLRNDTLRAQEDLDLSLSPGTTPTSNHQSQLLLPQEAHSSQVYVDASSSLSANVLQIRLTPRASRELDALLQLGFGSNKTTAIRRALEVHYRIISKTKEGWRFGSLSRLGDFTALPILDLVYPDVKPHSVSSFGSMHDSAEYTPHLFEIAHRPVWNHNLRIETFDGHGRYECVREITVNALAQRYLIRDRYLDRLCILKVAHNISNLDNGDFLYLFDRELTMTLSTRHSDFICGVVDAGIANWANSELPFLIIDFCPDMTLEEEIIASAIPRNLFSAINLVRRICLPVVALHDKHLIHGDLRPMNIAIMQNSNIKLLDCGLCLSLAENLDTLRNINRMIGINQSEQDLEFVAPELRSHESSVDFRSDIYSLGALLKYILDMWDLDHMYCNESDLPRATAWFAVQKVIDVALRNRPEERYQTVREFCDALYRPELLLYLTEDKSTRNMHHFSGSNGSSACLSNRQAATPIAKNFDFFARLMTADRIYQYLDFIDEPDIDDCDSSPGQIFNDRVIRSIVEKILSEDHGMDQ